MITVKPIVIILNSRIQMSINMCKIVICTHRPLLEGFMHSLPGKWWLVVSVIITMFASMFVQGAEGATFAMIPSIKKELTGRIAGMAGAYGNVGAVTYLFILSMVDSKTFFFVLAGGAAISFLWCFVALKEPKGAYGDDVGH